MIETLDNIERIAPPVTREKIERALASGVPFIVQGLLTGSFLEGCTTREATLAALGSGTITFDASGQDANATVAAYFERAGGSARGSVNVAFPPPLERKLLDFARQSPIGVGEMILTVWMGRPGCLQQFHCDMDCRHNFLVQTFGEKRVCVVSPAETQKMLPALDRQLLLSELPFHNHSPAEKLRILRFLGGYDGVLRAGEMLYIPPLWWHAVEYLTDSLSISWRVDHLPFFGELATAWDLLWPHEWPYWQGIVFRFVSQPSLIESHGGRVRDVLAGLRGGAAEARSAMRDLHDELCPGRYTLPTGAADLAFFEAREARPRKRKSGPWRPDEVPRLRPYARFATVMGAEPPHTILVLDGSRIIADISVDDEELEALQALLAELSRPGAALTVAELAARLGYAAEDLAALLEQLSGEGWITA